MWRDPGRTFQDPLRVLEQEDLSVDQKVEILRNWRLDLLELQRADDENMSRSETDSEAAELLRRVSEAIDSLTDLGTTAAGGP